MYIFSRLFLPIRIICGDCFYHLKVVNLNKLYKQIAVTLFTFWLQVDSENERCLVQFEDNTAHWSLYKDISKLKLPESDDLCVVCKSSKSWDTNEIVLCHICEQGYHQDCLQVCS